MLTSVELRDQVLHLLQPHPRQEDHCLLLHVAEVPEQGGEGGQHGLVAPHFALLRLQGEVGVAPAVLEVLEAGHEGTYVSPSVGRNSGGCHAQSVMALKQ